MTESQLREYAAHLAHEPPLRDVVRVGLAQLRAVLINVHRRKGAAAVDLKDLLPDPWEDQSPAARRRKLRGMLRGFAVMHGRVTNEQQ